MKVTIEFIRDPQLGMNKLNVSTDEPMEAMFLIGVLEAAKLDMYKSIRKHADAEAMDLASRLIGKSTEPEK